MALEKLTPLTIAHAGLKMGAAFMGGVVASTITNVSAVAAGVFCASYFAARSVGTDIAVSLVVAAKPSEKTYNKFINFPLKFCVQAVSLALAFLITVKVTAIALPILQGLAVGALGQAFSCNLFFHHYFNDIINFSNGLPEAVERVF